MNTIDVKGDAQTFKEIVEGTISEFTDDVVTKIKNYRFYGNSNLASVELPNVASVSERAFEKCEKLANANIPLLERTNNSAFASCGLVEANFPNMVQIGSSAFVSCKSMTSFNAPKLSSVGTSAFAYCHALREFDAPLVELVPNGGFAHCYSLTTVKLAKASYIYNSAFTNCSHLLSLYLLSTSVVNLYSLNAFYYTPMSSSSYTDSFGSIYVPASLVDAYKSANNWSVYSDRITAYTAE